MPNFDRWVSQVISVHDGDTQKIIIDQGWNDFKVINTRLKGVDCPEISTSAGEAVKNFVIDWLNTANQKYQLKWISYELDMYGRTLGDYWNEVRREFLSLVLLDLKKGKPMKKKRPVWSEDELEIAGT